jgi:hypothetical protein
MGIKLNVLAEWQNSNLFIKKKFIEFSHDKFQLPKLNFSFAPVSLFALINAFAILIRANELKE